MKPERNDPCPCGSGRKYKHCCLRAAPAAQTPESLAWSRLRRLLDGHHHDRLQFVSSVYGGVAFDEAWRRFTANRQAAFDPGHRDIPLFMPWLYHRWSPLRGKSRVADASLHGVIPTAEYLRRKKQLDPLLREYLDSCLASPFSVFEVLRADAGRGLLMKDLLSGEEHDVTERSASTLMGEGDIVFGQVARAGGVTLLEATQSFVIPPLCKLDIIEFRSRRFKGSITVAPERVRRAEPALFALYRDIARRLWQRELPLLSNTDGDPLSLRRVVFDVPSAREAFDALKHLALGQSEEDLLHDALLDADGTLQRVRFAWIKAGNAPNPEWDNTVLATIEIEGTRLLADVNSEQREQALRAIVAQALGKRAHHRATQIQSLQKLLSEDRAPTRAAAQDARLAELPEVQAKMRAMMARHYARWVHDKIPALGGRTPLEAVQDRAGREAVEALLCQLERDGSRTKPPLDPEIIRQLRERLDLPR
jgi:hypothetical protein